MYKGLSPGLAALMGLAVAGATTAEAAPFTGHQVTIKFTSVGDISPFLEKTTTVDEFNPEVTVADDLIFDVNDFLDIGANSVTLFTDGLGGFDIFDVEIDFTGSTDIDFTSFVVDISGSVGSPAVQVLTERIIIEDVIWNAGAITITGLEATTEASSSVPEPGALAGLGVGLMGMAGAGAARRRKKVTDQKDE